MNTGMPQNILEQKSEGHVLTRLIFDLTLYLSGPSLAEFEYLVNLYSNICPSDKYNRYTITELPFWPDINDPVLTKSARLAADNGVEFPYFQPVRCRITEGRAFDAQCWDGVEIDDPTGGWSFSCRRVHSQVTGLNSFVRFTLPLGEDHEILRKIAIAVVENVDIYSGHGGFCFTYNASLAETAFRRIYVQGKRYWGVDIEYLNASLPLMKTAIKGVSWITIIGNRLKGDHLVTNAIKVAQSVPSILVDVRRRGVIFVLGQQPTLGDERNIFSEDLKPYFKLASVLSPLFPTFHPDFPGEPFFEHGNTVGWVRRFCEPSGWSGRKFDLT